MTRTTRKNVSIFEAILLKYIIKINGAFLNELQTIVFKTETMREFFSKKGEKNKWFFFKLCYVLESSIFPNAPCYNVYAIILILCVNY